MADKTIKIIPWAHDFRSVYHDELLEALRTMDKPFQVALEVSPEAYQKNISLLEQLRDDRWCDPETIPVKRKMCLTQTEIVCVCQQRGVECIPMDNKELLRPKELTVPGLDACARQKALVKANRLREEHFVSVVRNKLDSSAVTIMVVGIAHVAQLQKLLNEVAPTSIETAIYSDPDSMTKAIAIGAKWPEDQAGLPSLLNVPTAFDDSEVESRASIFKGWA